MTHTPFVQRHIGLSDSDIANMLEQLGYDSLDQLTQAVVPESIADNLPLNLKEALSEEQALAELKAIAEKNVLLKSCLGPVSYTHLTLPTKA